MRAPDSRRLGFGPEPTPALSVARDEADALAIERACAHIVVRSLRAFDEQDWTAYAEWFTVDGTFIRANEPAQPLIGRAAIREALAARPASRLTRHLCTNLDIEPLAADRARGLCYVLLYAGRAEESARGAGRPAVGGQKVGEYHDTFVLTPEGWRIGRREGRLVFR